MSQISGVDGCRGGWIAIRKEVASGEISSAVYASSEELIYASPAPEVLALDIPIGLTNSGPRQCDLLARKMLGPSRGSSVFPAPIRPALAAADQSEASSISRSIDGKGVSAQAFAIYRRVGEVDELMRSDERALGYVREIHPELCFMAWNNGEPIIESKKSHQGMNVRLSLVSEHFGDTATSLVRKRHPAGQVADDDIYDAFAALWTAERILIGTAKSIPDQPEIDPLGLPMAMWY